MWRYDILSPGPPAPLITLVTSRLARGFNLARAHQAQIASDVRSRWFAHISITERTWEAPQICKFTKILPGPLLAPPGDPLGSPGGPGGPWGGVWGGWGWEGVAGPLVPIGAIDPYWFHFVHFVYGLPMACPGTSVSYRKGENVVKECQLCGQTQKSG